MIRTHLENLLGDLKLVLLVRLHHRERHFGGLIFVGHGDIPSGLGPGTLQAIKESIHRRFRRFDVDKVEPIRKFLRREIASLPGTAIASRYGW